MPFVATVKTPVGAAPLVKQSNKTTFRVVAAVPQSETTAQSVTRRSSGALFLILPALLLAPSQPAHALGLGKDPAKLKAAADARKAKLKASVETAKAKGRAADVEGFGADKGLPDEKRNGSGGP